MSHASPAVTSLPTMSMPAAMNFSTWQAAFRAAVPSPQTGSNFTWMSAFKQSDKPARTRRTRLGPPGSHWEACALTVEEIEIPLPQELEGKNLKRTGLKTNKKGYRHADFNSKMITDIVEAERRAEAQAKNLAKNFF